MPRFERLLRLAAIAPLFASCTQSHAVVLEVAGTPTDGSARTFTVRVYRGTTCPTVEALARDADGTLERVYAQTATAGAMLPPVGTLDPGPYTFAALARDARCQPIAYGCTTADPSTTARVRIELASKAWDPGLSPCSDGVGCSDGLCTGGPTCDPAACTTPGGTSRACCGDACVDLTTDPTHCGRCEVTCPPDQACVGGTCSAPTTCSAPCGASETCCGDVCVNLATDPRVCGACGHACPAGLACERGACRPTAADPGVRVRLPDTLRTDCGRALLVLIWVTTDATGSAMPEIGATLAIDPMMIGMEVTFPLTSVRPPSDPARCGLSPDCSVPVSFGQIRLVVDTNSDGAVSLTELRGVAFTGIADVAVVMSGTDISRTDDRLRVLTERTRIAFPEGILAGTTPYRRGPDGTETWIPTSDAFTLSICGSTAADCTSPVDEACRAGLPHPFGYVP